MNKISASSSPQKRAFRGLVGRSIGRPRKFASDTERQRAHRAKKKKQEALDQIDSMDRGLSMPQGYQLVSGGHDAERLGMIAFRNGVLKGGEIVGRPHGKKVRPAGYGPETVAKNEESDSTFASQIRFPANWKLSASEKEEIIKDILHGWILSPESSTDTNWNADTKEYPVIAATHECRVCGSMFDWLSEARAHILRKHGPDIRRIIRQCQPQQTPSGEFRDSEKSRLRVEPLEAKPLSIQQDAVDGVAI